ncbi:MAG: oxidoreductase [Planctomycetaceae bacterium]|nr:oxidoreductase [Planctomycetaceae bacterium]
MRATRTDNGQHVALCQLTPADLSAGDVLVRVEYSSLNYKDALAVTGRAPIIRRYPLVPGIDLAGEVVQSDSPRFITGQRVLATGFGIGETHDGGFAQYARIPSDWLVPLPDIPTPGPHGNPFTTADAMKLGTAGLTAMLCVMALESQRPDTTSGELLVTGATGGVGSVAVMLAAAAGWRVTACSRRPEKAEILKSWGAEKIVDQRDLASGGKPLQSAHWSAAIDVAGGTTLANILAQLQPGGIAVACGLADDMNLPTTMAPFILRGVRLIGVESVFTPMTKRLAAWRRLAQTADLAKLNAAVREISIHEIPSEAAAMLDGNRTGRALVKILHSFHKIPDARQLLLQ